MAALPQAESIIKAMLGQVQLHARPGYLAIRVGEEIEAELRAEDGAFGSTSAGSSVGSFFCVGW